MGWQTPEPPLKPERPARPVGVSILTIWNGTIAGLFPILGFSIQLMRGSEAGSSDLLLCFTPMISAAVIFTAIGAYRGHDPSRLGQIITLIIYNAILAFNAFGEVTVGTSEEGQMIAYLRMVGYVLWAGITTWYFLRRKTVEFYRYSVNR
jgi:signal transduction histidine kinase